MIGNSQASDSRSDEGQCEVDSVYHLLHCRDYEIPETVSRIRAFGHYMGFERDQGTVIAIGGEQGFCKRCPDLSWRR